MNILRRIPPVAVPISISDVLHLVLNFIFVPFDKIVLEFKKRICINYHVESISTFQSGIISLFYLFEKIKIDNKRKNVILPAYTCPTILLSIKKANLNPIFVDIELDNFCISLDKVIDKIDENTLSIVIPHMFGYFLDISKLTEFRKINNGNYYIIEDFCQSFLNTNLWSQNRGDFGILSFARAKCISTINGGAVITFNDYYSGLVNELEGEKRKNNIYIIIKSLIYGLAVTPFLYSITYKILSKQRNDDIFNLRTYDGIDFLDRSSLSKAQLALGVIMLKKINVFNKIRYENAKYYFEYLSHIAYTQPEKFNTYLRFAVVFKNDIEKQKYCLLLEEKGILHSTADYPVLSTINEHFAAKSDDNFPIASFIASNIINFPTHPLFLVRKIDPFCNNL